MTYLPKEKIEDIIANAPPASYIKFGAQCKGQTLYEFPILTNKKVFTGAEKTPAIAPGTDRVVVTVSKRDKKGNVAVTYCGLMTHTGAAQRNGFVAC